MYDHLHDTVFIIILYILHYISLIIFLKQLILIYFHLYPLDSDALRRTQYTTFTALSVLLEHFFGELSHSAVAEVTDSAVLGGVVDVVSSNLSQGKIIFFRIYRHS